jgi:hypothetical protein
VRPVELTDGLRATIEWFRTGGVPEVLLTPAVGVPGR